MKSNEAALKKAVDNLRSQGERRNAEDAAAIKRAVVKIKVFGIGGGGNSVLKRLAESKFAETDLVAVNTDSHALSLLNMESIRSIQIGETLTKGHGTGGNVSLGEQAAKADAERIRNMMLGADMIFITAGRRNRYRRGTGRCEDCKGTWNADSRSGDSAFQV